MCMTPWQIAKDSESSHQTALFCYINKAIQVGFKQALDPNAYVLNKSYQNAFLSVPIPELYWCHHVPNGGSRGDTAISRAIAGGQLKAEGVRPGVLDIFWPLRRSRAIDEFYCGLYIEMKKPNLRHKTNLQAGCSDAQLQFGEFVIYQQYAAKVCYTWLEAAEILEWYYNLGE